MSENPPIFCDEHDVVLYGIAPECRSDTLPSLMSFACS
ncbi:hypothetical protein MLPF_0200 [Mycobacterium lepromatosis]|nr:hypothetical protein MLPF_0200 [Mycobacterium lepromatosis]